MGTKLGILNYKPLMEYRRFGKTEANVSTITLGGMRLIRSWEQPKYEIPKETIEHGISVIGKAFEYGINTIETAEMYVKSEKAYGIILNNELNIPRNSYYLMTKGIARTAYEIRSMVEQQLTDLQTDYFDFYAFHGMNNQKIIDNTCSKDGVVEELHKMKEEGIINNIGFSSHAPLEINMRAIETGLFSFANMHYYYFNQRNKEAVSLAQKNDMGVLIISPNDKGGQLFRAPDKVRKAIPHCTPIQWNSRFCLQTPGVSTLSFGMTEQAHFDEMQDVFPISDQTSSNDMDSKTKLDNMINDAPYASFMGFDLANDPSGINFPEILRLRRLWKCYDMLSFAKYRYKEYRIPNHWNPGVLCTPENIEKIDMTKIPDHIPIKDMLTEFHSECGGNDLILA